MRAPARGKAEVAGWPGQRRVRSRRGTR